MDNFLYGTTKDDDGASGVDDGVRVNTDDDDAIHLMKQKTRADLEDVKKSGLVASVDNLGVCS